MPGTTGRRRSPVLRPRTEEGKPVDRAQASPTDQRRGRRQPPPDVRAPHGLALVSVATFVMVLVAAMLHAAWNLAMKD
ncbi:MAG: hypothetical protein WAX12_10715, partial [Candidatus Microthrix subdominans]